MDRAGTLGLTGKEARVEDEIYIVHVYLSQFGNLKVSISETNHTTTKSQFGQSKVGLKPNQAGMKGRVAVRTFLLHFV